MSWPLGYFGYDPSRKGTGKVAIHHTEWDHEPWPTMAFSHPARPSTTSDGVEAIRIRTLIVRTFFFSSSLLSYRS